MNKLREELATIVKPEYHDAWITSPSKFFGGKSPLEIIEDGDPQELHDLWRAIYVMQSGEPLL